MSLDLLAVPYPSRERESPSPSRRGEKLETHLQESNTSRAACQAAEVPPGQWGPCGVTMHVHAGHNPLAQIQQSQGIGEGVRPGQRHGGESPHPTRALSLQNDWTETRVRVLHGTELFTIKNYRRAA